MRDDYRDKSFWLQQDLSYQEDPALQGEQRFDVAIVGGGFCGLATAYFLKKAEPSLRVCVLEAQVVGFGASGRNAGFVMTTFGLTLGLTKALYGEQKTRQAHAYMQRAVDLVGELVDEHHLDCDYERTGFLRLATTTAYVKRIQTEIELAKRLKLEGIEWLEAPVVQQRVHSSLYLGAWWESSCALVNPAKLVRELKRLVRAQGVMVFERTQVKAIDQQGGKYRLETDLGQVQAERIALTTNAYSGKLSQLKGRQVPVWTHIVLTEPLTDKQLEEIGWKGREGLEDYRNLVHYYRLTPDNRLLMGGANVTIGYGLDMERDQNERVFSQLERDIGLFFPSLRGIPITHRWGGPVSVPIQLTPALGYLGAETAVYSLGCMGHGVSLSHLNGQVLADLLLQRKSAWTDSFPVGRRLIPWPPEPLRYAGSQVILRSLQAEDLWCERAGLGV